MTSEAGALDLICTKLRAIIEHSLTLTIQHEQPQDAEE